MTHNYYFVITCTLIGLLSTGYGALSQAEDSPCQGKDQTLSGTTAENPARDYIEFYDQLDGKCQILSSGGKLTLVKNNHPDKKIRYRFVRMFAGKPQAGVVFGILDPADGPLKMGCNRVDDHEQIWDIKVAEFME